MRPTNFARRILYWLSVAVGLVLAIVPLPEWLSPVRPDLAGETAAWSFVDLGGGGEGQAAMIGFGDQRLRDHVMRGLIERGGEAQQLDLVPAIDQPDIDHGGAAEGQRAGLVENGGADAGQRF